MKDGLEIYVRPKPEGLVLNIHAPDAAKKRFIADLKAGACSGSASAIFLELSVLPEWISDDQPQAAEALRILGSIHLRLPIAAINLVNG